MIDIVVTILLLFWVTVILVSSIPTLYRYYFKLTKAKHFRFQPEFESKLKDLGVRNLFIDNIVKLNDIKSLSNNYLQDLNQVESWRDFITCAFRWEKSKQGRLFWFFISIGYPKDMAETVVSRTIPW